MALGAISLPSFEPSSQLTAALGNLFLNNLDLSALDRSCLSPDFRGNYFKPLYGSLDVLGILVESLTQRRQIKKSRYIPASGEKVDPSIDLCARQKSKVVAFQASHVKVYSSQRQKSHLQRQWARLARRGWCAGVVPTAPWSLERIRREMKQAKPPARARGSTSFPGLISAARMPPPALSGGGPGSGGGNPFSIDQRPKPRKEGQTESSRLLLYHCPRCQRLMRAWNKIRRREGGRVLSKVLL